MTRDLRYIQQEMNISYDVWNMILDTTMYNALIYSYINNNDKYLFDQIIRLVSINKSSRRQVYRFLYDNTGWFNTDRLSKTKCHMLQIIDSNILTNILDTKELRVPLKIKWCYKSSEYIQCIFKTKQDIELLVLIDLGQQSVLTGIRHYGATVNCKYIGFSLRTRFNYQDVKVMRIYHVTNEEMSRISKNGDYETNLCDLFRRIKSKQKIPKIQYINKYKWVFNSNGNINSFEALKDKKGIILTHLSLSPERLKWYHNYIENNKDLTLISQNQ